MLNHSRKRSETPSLWVSRGITTVIVSKSDYVLNVFAIACECRPRSVGRGKRRSSRGFIQRKPSRCDYDKHTSSCRYGRIASVLAETALVACRYLRIWGCFQLQLPDPDRRARWHPLRLPPLSSRFSAPSLRPHLAHFVSRRLLAVSGAGVSENHATACLAHRLSRKPHFVPPVHFENGLRV